jgi:hypothetical protein
MEADETELQEPFYAPLERDSNHQQEKQQRQHIVTFIHVSTAAFYAQTIPHKSHYNTSQVIPCHLM